MTAPKGQTVETRYVCLGERALEVKEILGISPSAEKALASYLTEAIPILESHKDGLPDWEKVAWDHTKNRALQALDIKEEYDPLLVETLLYFEWWNSGMEEGRESFLFRGEDGEIHATDEGVKIYTQRIRESFEKKKRYLQNHPAKLTDDSFYPFYLFFLLVAVGEPIYHPRAHSILNEEQRKLVDTTLGAIANFFTPHFKTPPDEVLVGFSYYYGKYISEPPEMKNSTELKTLLDVPKKQRFATSPVPRYATPLMWNHALWKEKEGMLLYFAPKTKERVDITYIITQKDRGAVRAASGEEAWAIVQNLGMETALLHVTFAASCMATKQPWSNYAKAEGGKLIKLLRLNEKKKWTPEGKRVRLTREEQLQELKKYLRSLKAIYVLVKDEYDNVIEASEVPVPLWDMDIRLIWQAGIFPDNGNPMDINVYIRAGTWAMRETGSRGFMLYSHLYKRILDFNLLTEDWAFKWAIYTSCFMGASGSHTFKIRTLLEAVMNPEEVKRQEDPVNRQGRYGTVTKLESQLQDMERHGWKIKRSPDYQRAMRTRSSRRPRNFFPELLESTITLTPPDTTEKSLPRGEKPELGPVCNPEATEPLTGTIFRDQRIRLGLSQKEAGRIIGKSQGFISLVEKGRRCLSLDDQKKWEEVTRKIEQNTTDTP